MGSVYLGMSAHDGTLMAVREILPTPEHPRSQQELESLERDVAFMRRFSREDGALPRVGKPFELWQSE